MNRSEKAVKCFCSGCNCAQAVFTAFCKGKWCSWNTWKYFVKMSLLVLNKKLFRFFSFENNLYIILFIKSFIEKADLLSLMLSFLISGFTGPGINSFTLIPYSDNSWTNCNNFACTISFEIGNRCFHGITSSVYNLNFHFTIQNN